MTIGRAVSVVSEVVLVGALSAAYLAGALGAFGIIRPMDVLGVVVAGLWVAFLAAGVYFGKATLDLRREERRRRTLFR